MVDQNCFRQCWEQKAGIRLDQSEGHEKRHIYDWENHMDMCYQVVYNVFGD